MSVFADAFYWIALLNDKDQGHAAAQTASQSLGQATIVTTQEVLSEVLTHCRGVGRFMRQSAAVFVRNVLANPTITVREQSDPSFLSGLSLYESRPDKAYSLTDCISCVANLVMWWKSWPLLYFAYCVGLNAT
jgi:predicted nucleic acid-binding protein